MRIFAAAIASVDPRKAVASALDGVLPGTAEVPDIIHQAHQVRLLAAGKAALGMAVGATESVATKLSGDLVIRPTPPSNAGGIGSLPEGPEGQQGRGLHILTAAHPTPDASSERAGRAALEFTADAGDDDLVLFLLSGGASALMTVPATGLALADKVSISTALMNSGASIGELNTVRKHLSAIKGGRLLRASGAKFLTLILSDVPGNDLATIGSGPTAPDPTSYTDAVMVLKRRRVWGRAPESVRDHLERGAAGEFEETLRRDDPALARARNIILADNATAVEAASNTASSLGYNVFRYRSLTGDANDVGGKLGTYLSQVDGERAFVVAGGEMVVSVRGKGRGGRAQQAALAMAIELAKSGTNRRVMGMFAGTDGIDGPTDAAGAIVGVDTVARAVEAKLDANQALQQNDAYNFFKALGDLVITGPTGTNVADIFIGLVDY